MAKRLSTYRTLRSQYQLPGCELGYHDDKLGGHDSPKIVFVIFRRFDEWPSGLA